MPCQIVDELALPLHIQATIRSIDRLHQDYHQHAGPLHRFTRSLTIGLGRPILVGVLALLAAIWMALNVAIAAKGFRVLDPPPFSWMQDAVSLASLLMIVAILATQQRDEELAQLRQQLALELAILSEQKTAKIIELIEELRRDDPLLKDRVDKQAEAMARPSDPDSVIEAIKAAHSDAASRR